MPVFLDHEIAMPRDTLGAAVLDLGQAIGLSVRRMRAAAAWHQLSLTEAAVMAHLARAESMKLQSMGTTIASHTFSGTTYGLR